MAFVPSWLRPPQVWLESRLATSARRLRGLGLEATHLTWAQLPLVGVAAALIVAGQLAWASAALLSSVVLDMLDGFYARATGTTTRRGHRLDKAMDLVGIAAFLLAVGWIRPDLVAPLGLTGLATVTLYAIGWFYDPELVTGARAAGLAWLWFPEATWVLWLPGIAGGVLAPVAWMRRRPKTPVPKTR